MLTGTYENKVDKKGRVSVPANFRHILAPHGTGVILAYRSIHDPAIEACTPDFMERLGAQVSGMDYLSRASSALKRTLFGDANPLAIDGDGRIILPQKFLDHAQIGDTAAFIGLNDTFQIWNPDTLESARAAAIEQLRESELSLSPVPQEPVTP